MANENVFSIFSFWLLPFKGHATSGFEKPFFLSKTFLYDVAGFTFYHMIMLLFVMHILQKLVSYSMICLQMQATIKEEPLEEENEEEETRDDFAPQQRSRYKDRRWLIGHLFSFSFICFWVFQNRQFLGPCQSFLI